MRCDALDRAREVPAYFLGLRQECALFQLVAAHQRFGEDQQIHSLICGLGRIAPDERGRIAIGGMAGLGKTDSEGHGHSSSRA